MTDPLAQRAVEFITNPAEAVKDFVDIFNGFGSVFRDDRDAELACWSLAVSDDAIRTPTWLMEKVSQFVMAMELAQRQRPETFSLIDLNQLRRFSGLIVSPLRDGSNCLFQTDAERLFDIYLRVCHDYECFAAKVQSDELSHQVEVTFNGDAKDGGSLKPVSNNKKKQDVVNHSRSNEELFKAGLKRHHQYIDGSVMNYEPISTRKLAALLENRISASTANRLMARHFGSVKAYKKCCVSKQINGKLMLLTGDTLHALGTIDPNRYEIEDDMDN